MNTSKYEAWLGAGLNFQRIDTAITVTAGGGGGTDEASAKGTVPIPTLNFGGRWDFNKRVRMLLMEDLFGIKIGDFEGRLSNTRVLVEVNLAKGFGLGAGFERYKFEVSAESDEFLGDLDTSYTGLSLYLVGQF